MNFIAHRILNQRSEDEFSILHQQLEELQFSFGQIQYGPSSSNSSVNFNRFVFPDLHTQALVKEMGIAHGDPTHQSTK